MTGRITSESAPARNTHGVAYCELLERERVRNRRMEKKLRAVVAAWLAADQTPLNSRERREATEIARLLTEKVLN